MNHSIFTVMAPDLAFEELCPLLQQLGYDGIEVRIADQQPAADGVPSYWSGNRATLSASHVLNEIEHLAALCRQHDLTIFALGTYLNPLKGLEETERMMKAARLVGCPQIRVHDGGYQEKGGNYRQQWAAGLEVFKKVEKLARQYGVRANLETHPNHLVVSASAHYHFVKNFDPDCIGVIYDVGNMVIEGYENWRAGLELLGEYLAYIHIKNCSKKPAGVKEDGSAKWEPDVFGAGGTLKGGMVDMQAFIQLLNDIGYSGWLSQEDFSKVLDTRGKLTENITYLKMLEKANND